MGLDFSFCLIFEAGQVNLVLKELSLMLCDSDARRLNVALPWQPKMQESVVWGSGNPVRERAGIDKLKTDQHEHPNDYCFSFVFPMDAQLKAYAVDMPEDLMEKDKVRIGCIWTKLCVGSEYALLTCTAATSDMSLLFQASQNIRDAWVSFASRTQSLALFFDSEGEFDWLLLYPEVRIAKEPAIDCFYSSDFEILRTDQYCREALHLSMLF